MDINYLVSRRTDGANPVKIWNFIQLSDADKICWFIERMPYHEFLRTAYWFAVASKRKSDLGMRCQVCNESGTLNVHHRTYETHGREHENLNDLCVLCEFCHGIFHGHLEHQPGKFRIKPKRDHVRVKPSTIIPHSDDDIKLPAGDMVVLTQDLINACRANGSFTNATLRAFGLNRSTMARGWPRLLEGKELSSDDYRKAQEGRFIYNSGRLT